MKICRVSQTYPTTENNGIGLHTYHTSNLLQYPTLVLTSYCNAHFLPAAPHVTVQPISYLKYPFPKDRKNSPYKFLLALFAYGIGQLQFALKSISHIIRFKPTIVHLQSPHAILIGLFAKFFIQSKLVITFHGSDLRRIKDNKLYLQLLKPADKIFYVSSSMFDQLIKHFDHNQLVHTPSGIDTEFFSSRTSNFKDKIILAVGNLRWQKDYSTLLDALKIVFEKKSNFSAVIIGSGPEEELLKNKSNSLGISDKVHFLGQQPKEVVRDYLYKSEIFVLSSVTEGMPKAILEALITGVPIVATSVGAIPEVLNGIGLTVAPQNPKALADGLLQAISGEVTPEMISRGEQLAFNYSWSHLADLLENEFLTLSKQNLKNSG